MGRSVRGPRVNVLRRRRPPRTAVPRLATYTRDRRTVVLAARPARAPTRSTATHLLAHRPAARASVLETKVSRRPQVLLID